MGGREDARAKRHFKAGFTLYTHSEQVKRRNPLVFQTGMAEK
jgi:hypothetical protein